MQSHRDEHRPELPVCSLAEIAALTGGEVLGGPAETQIRGLSIDSREAQAGQLFVALPGERADGHDFLGQVWARGCPVLAHRLPPQLGGACVLVGDTLSALQRWAARDLELRPARVCGITGSVGKTSIKEMCAAVLSRGFLVHRTRQNRNGQIGVAMTILERPSETEMLVLEMGISLPGEMARLVAMAPPEVAVLSRLGEVHRENFPSFADLVSEKRRILLGNEGRPLRCAVVHVETWERVAPIAAVVRTYGFAAGADIRGDDLRAHRPVGSGRPSSTFSVHGLSPQPVVIRLPFSGRAMAENALCALAVGRELGIPVSDLQASLEDVQLDAPMRQEWHSVNGITWINDAYNASPASMVAALELLQTVPATGKKIAVLGDMLELGPDSEALHRGLAGPLAQAADRLLAFGPRSMALVEASEIPAEGHTDIERLCQRVLETVETGDVVLIKASRGMRLERVAESLQQRWQKPR